MEPDDRENADEQAIRRLVADWLAATTAGDAERIMGLMADDVVFLMPGQPPMSKSDFAAGQAALRQFDLQMASEIQEITVFGEWAYCWNKLSVTVTPRAGGTPVKRAGNALSILQKRAGAWVVVRDANMLAVVP
jgi:uncharacterized protein (TIGR02246 family)